MVEYIYKDVVKNSINKKNKIMEELKKHLHKKIILIYNGTDLPSGEIPPVDVEGTLIEVNSHNCILRLENGEELSLVTSDIDPEMILVLGWYFASHKMADIDWPFFLFFKNFYLNK